MQPSKKIILDLCGGTGAWSKPYKDKGYDVRNITLPKYDIRGYEPPSGVYGILAAPPCPMFSIARNDKTAKIKRDFKVGLELVRACLDIIWECRCDEITNTKTSLQFWALENPRGYLRWFLGMPTTTFHPYEFGDPYTKETDIWGIFDAPVRNPTMPLRFGNSEQTFVKEVEHFSHLKEHQIPNGYKEQTGYTKRAILRSITPSGFSIAFFEANQ